MFHKTYLTVLKRLNSYIILIEDDVLHQKDNPLKVRSVPNNFIVENPPNQMEIQMDFEPNQIQDKKINPHPKCSEIQNIAPKINSDPEDHLNNGTELIDIPLVNQIPKKINKKRKNLRSTRENRLSPANAHFVALCVTYFTRFT